MPNFLAALMTLVSTFAQGGKPATLPPNTQDQVTVRGSAVSNIAKNMTTGGVNNQNVNAQGSSNASSNATFGQGIANSQPDSAKTDGQTFGQSTAASARSNSRRP